MQTHLNTQLSIASIAFIGAALLNPADAATNTPPVISGSPVTTAVAGQMYSFQPSATDADGNTLVYSVTSKPAWALIDRVTGRFYGKPTNAQAGVYEQIEISVSDATSRAKLPKFSITVAPDSTLGRAPTISGTPVTTATVNAAYSFKPQAMDLDGDALTFSTTGRPAWATLNKQTGELTGTPVTAGVYNGVEISVSDGVSRTALPKFSITVSPQGQPVKKSVALNWLAPSMNTDGTALTNLSGYRIVYGSQPGQYTQSVTINGVGMSSYVVENLDVGKYYFALIARNTTGVESARSSEVSVNLL